MTDDYPQLTSQPFKNNNSGSSPKSTASNGQTTSWGPGGPSVRQHPHRFPIRVYPVTSCTKESLMVLSPKRCLEPIDAPWEDSIRCSRWPDQSSFLDAMMGSKPCKSMARKSVVLAAQHLEVVTHILQCSGLIIAALSFPRKWESKWAEKETMLEILMASAVIAFTLSAGRLRSSVLAFNSMPRNYSSWDRTSLY